jgi:hypothetical protein
LGPTPAGESAVRPGDSGYAEIAFLECRRHIALLRRAIGLEPEGACLRVRRSEDIELYLDVAVEYDDENPVARAYAIRCDREGPTRWV